MLLAKQIKLKHWSRHPVDFHWRVNPRLDAPDELDVARRPAKPPNSYQVGAPGVDSKIDLTLQPLMPPNIVAAGNLFDAELVGDLEKTEACTCVSCIANECVDVSG